MDIITSMFKTVIKSINLAELNFDEASYVEFKNNLGWNESYVKTLMIDGYSSDYVAIHESKVISYKYSSILWLMALRFIRENFINEDISEVPNGVIIQNIESEESLNTKENQKWIIPVTYIYKCESCKELFDGNCSCIQ